MKIMLIGFLIGFAPGLTLIPSIIIEWMTTRAYLKALEKTKKKRE